MNDTATKSATSQICKPLAAMLTDLANLDRQTKKTSSMKKFYIISWTIFFIGFIFKLFHLPAAGLLMSIGSLLILIHSIIHFTKYVKTDLPLTLLYASIAFMTVYLLSRLHYWSIARPIFPIACLLSLATIILLFYKKVEFAFPQYFLIAYFIFFFTISYTPSYKIFYIMTLNSVLNGESRNTDYRGWDKYSWFLYLDDKNDEALEANTNARDALNTYLKIIDDNEAAQFSNLIDRHNQQIRERNWSDYP